MLLSRAGFRKYNAVLGSSGDLLNLKAGWISLVLMALAVAASAQGVVLGALEEFPGDYAGEQNFYAVRILFEKEADGWLAFRSQCPDQDCPRTTSSEFPSQSEWT